MLAEAGLRLALEGADTPPVRARLRNVVGFGHGLVVPLALPPLIGLLLFMVSDTHRLLPGMAGCGLVRDAAAQIDCYGDQAAQIAARDGSETAIAEIDERSRTDADLRAECHMVLHRVGEPEGRRAGRAGDSFPEFPAQSFCHDGYVHGYFIGYLETAALDTGSMRAVSAHCGAQEDDGAVVSCAHAVGHVLARRAARDMERAATGCEQLTHRSEATREAARFDCAYGASMEYTVRDLQAGRERPLDNCTKVRGELGRRACYTFLPGRVAQLAGSLEDAAGVCERAPTTADRAACIHGYARAATRGDCNAFSTASLRRACSRPSGKLQNIA